MLSKKFKFSANMLDEMIHKSTGVTYDNEEKRSEELLNIIADKVYKVMPKEKRSDCVKRIEQKQNTVSSYKDWCKLELSKFKKQFAYLEITQEEFCTWYKYWLEYYYDDGSYYGDIRECGYPFDKFKSHKKIRSMEYLEAKKLLNKMFKVFTVNTFDENHRAGSKLNFVKSLLKKGITPDQIVVSNTTKH
jgi:hypothetical protein